MKYGLSLLIFASCFATNAFAELKKGPGYLIKKNFGLQGKCEIVDIQADYVVIRLPGYTTDAGLALVKACDVISESEVKDIQASRGAG